MRISLIRFSLLLMLGASIAACSNTGKQVEPAPDTTTRPWWVRTTRMLLRISRRKGKKILVLLNFRDHDVRVNSGVEYRGGQRLIGNYPAESAAGILGPYEAVVYRL